MHSAMLVLVILGDSIPSDVKNHVYSLKHCVTHIIRHYTSLKHEWPHSFSLKVDWSHLTIDRCMKLRKGKVDDVEFAIAQDFSGLIDTMRCNWSNIDKLHQSWSLIRTEQFKSGPLGELVWRRTMDPMPFGSFSAFCKGVSVRPAQQLQQEWKPTLLWISVRVELMSLLCKLLEETLSLF